MSDIRKVLTTKKQTEEEKVLLENTKLMEEYLSENDEKNLQTNILNEIRFANKQDEYVFNMLPLTLKQKEELLLNLYGTNNKDDIKLDPSQ
jgi:glucuronate isomerase